MSQRLLVKNMIYEMVSGERDQNHAIVVSSVCITRCGLTSSICLLAHTTLVRKSSDSEIVLWTFARNLNSLDCHLMTQRKQVEGQSNGLNVRV